MKKREIEKKLHTSLQENAPDAWEEIARRTGLESREVRVPSLELVPAVESGERNPAPRVYARKPWFIACVFALAALLISLLLYPVFANSKSGIDGISNSFFIDINPSIQVTLTKDERVDEVIPLNEDAKILLADSELAVWKGKSPEEVLAYVWELAYKTGYLAPDKQDNALLLSSAMGSAELETAFVARMKNSLNAVIKNAGVYCAVLTETRNAALQAEAQKYNVTEGKYQLLRRAIALGVEIDEDDFDDISIKELNAKIAKKAKELNGKDDQYESYKQQKHDREEQAKVKNDAYSKSEDFEDLFEEWLEQIEDEYEERWEDKKEEWKENNRREYDHDDDDDDDD